MSSRKSVLPVLFTWALTLLSSFAAIHVSAVTMVDASGYLFDSRDVSCDGFPALKVQTMPGTCLGLVVSQNGNLDRAGKSRLRMPRLIVKLPNRDDFLISDMGGWAPKIGKLFWLKKTTSGFDLIELMDKLDLAHGLAFNDHDKYFYLGENNRVIRFHFDADAGKVSGLQTVIANLPDVARHMHPLTQFVFDPSNGDMYLNSGAPTDHCFQSDGQYKRRCNEEFQQKMATIQKVSKAKLSAVTDSQGLQLNDFEVVAQGLRNSMAMAIHPSGRFLIQGENSRDFPELEEPYEELNVVPLKQSRSVRHYGWPYCFNNHAVSPEWDKLVVNEPASNLTSVAEIKKLHGENPFYCGWNPIQGLKDYQRPYSLIPPHAAPLAAGYYEGAMFAPELGGKLLMSFHGHRSTGHRFVAYPVNRDGLPRLGRPQNEKYNFSLPNGCTSEAPINPRGGLRQHFARYDELISGWGPVKGLRPKGAPTGFAVASDGSIFIVEDKNKTVVRLAKSQSANYQPDCGSAALKNVDANIELLAWRNALTTDGLKEQRAQYLEIARELRKPERCLKCHEGLVNKDLREIPDAFATLDFFVRSGWFEAGDPDKSLLYGALSANGIAPAMPPAGFDSLQTSEEGRKILQTVRTWIDNLPRDIATRVAQANVGRNVNIRPAPTTASQPCGQLKNGDVIYIDPRPATRISAAGNVWTKVYLVPGHTRLVPGACDIPIDGVYYAAIP